MRLVATSAVVLSLLGFASQKSIAADVSQLQNSNNSSAFPLSMMNYSGGNDWTRYEIAPNWSRELGWSLKGAFGSYITNDLAVGAIVEYGQDKREYLTNAGVRLSDKISFIGSVGILEEHREFVADAGKETVQQMEYGASLKGAYEFGLFHGFELNGYLADANTKSDNIETGKLYGTQILTNVNLTDSTRIKLGGGYEWLRWDEGEENNAFSFRADGFQQITNKLSANANVKLGASEYVYGGGLAYNFGDHSNSNIFGLNYDYIEGQHGIANDQRIELSWRIGFGVGPNSPSAKKASMISGQSNGTNQDGANSWPANTLLADVMKRAEFLPKRVLARAKAQSGGCSSPFIVDKYYPEDGQTEGSFVYNYNGSYSYVNIRFPSDAIPTDTSLTIDGNVYSQHPNPATYVDRGDGTTDVGFFADTFVTPYVDGQSYTIDYNGCSQSITAWDYSVHASPP